MLASRTIELLDNEVLIAQLAGLERRVRSGGKEIIDHARSKNAHDDISNVCAGAASIVGRQTVRFGVFGLDDNFLSDDVAVENMNLAQLDRYYQSQLYH